MSGQCSTLETLDHRGSKEDKYCGICTCNMLHLGTVFSDDRSMCISVKVEGIVLNDEVIRTDAWIL